MNCGSKLSNKKKKDKSVSRLDEIKYAPALVQAQEVQKKAAQLGFDFETVTDAYAKLEEELGELQQAIRNQKMMKYKKNSETAYFL